VATFTADLQRMQAEMARRHRRDHPDIGGVLSTGDDRLWERRVHDDEPLRVTLGQGAWRWTAPLAEDDRRVLQPDLLAVVEHCERLAEVAIPLELGPSDVVAFTGETGAVTALARSVVIQLATLCGPADWQLVVITDDPPAWDWAHWLPHCRAVTAPETSFVDLGPHGTSETLVVTDSPGALVARTGPLRRFLDATGAAAVVVVHDGRSVPSVCRRVFHIGSGGQGDWRDRVTMGDAAVHVAGITRPTAETAARRLAPLLDPEDPGGQIAGLPTSTSLRRLLPPGAFDPQQLARRWRQADDGQAPIATIGASTDGTVEIDLVRDGPHGLIAGTTGAGKSELLRTLVVSLALASSPEHVSFVLVDYKGGATFDACTSLPHVVGVVTDLDEGLAERALVSLDAEIRRREHLLRSAGVDDIVGFRRATGAPMPRLVVVVDEFAGLARELPDFLAALLAVAQRGRSLGVHLLLATQRPAGVVTDDIRANTTLRLALRLPDRADAMDVVGDALPSTFPRTAPGRAVLRLGPDELIVFQTASCRDHGGQDDRSLRVDWADEADGASGTGDPDGDSDGELAVLVAAIGEAALIAGTTPPHRPWVDPLPTLLLPVDLAELNDPSTLAVVDDPAAQCRRALRWDATGNLLLIGSMGGGTTTAAIAAAVSFARGGDPDERHLYVIDGHGEPALDQLAAVAHCGGVVRIAEHERVDRLLRRLTDEIDRRSLDGEHRPTIVLLVDGLAAVRAALGCLERAHASAWLDRVLRDGPAVDVVTCATTDGVSAGTVAAIAGERWLFRVDDPSVATALGVRRQPDVPGRVVVVETGLTGQVVFDPDAAARLPRRDDRHGPAPLTVLPPVVDPTELEPSSTSSGSLLLAVGLGATDLSTVHLDVPVGDHILVAGPARSGRSTILGQLIASWRAVHPGGAVVTVTPRTALADQLGDVGTTPLLVVVDDAERVDDPDGRLTAIAAGRRPGVTIAAAARMEAVRAAYGHWVRDVARSHCGMLLTTTGDVDGELLGATLPRRSPIPARPGLAWVIDRHGPRLAQAAGRMPS
jgi:DNA segregation ATPase FtsK/SpoIIIE, S-DNA-T family